MWAAAICSETGLVVTVGAALIVVRTQCLCLLTSLVPLLSFLCLWICSFSALFCSPLCPLWLAPAQQLVTWSMEAATALLCRLCICTLYCRTFAVLTMCVFHLIWFHHIFNSPYATHLKYMFECIIYKYIRDIIKITQKSNTDLFVFIN